jgi:hypothetical protein
VLVIDADEVVTPGLAEEIQMVVAAATRGDDQRIGFDMRISLVFLGREMRGGEARRRSLRLFDRRRGNFAAARVHERLALDGPIGHLRHEVLHHSYAGLEDYFEKFNRYTSAGAADLLARGSKAGVATIVFRFPITFVRQYLVRGNILNGYPGFLWSVLSAVYPVVKYAKLHELRRRK